LLILLSYRLVAGPDFCSLSVRIKLITLASNFSVFTICSLSIVAAKGEAKVIWAGVVRGAHLAIGRKHRIR